VDVSHRKEILDEAKALRARADYQGALKLYKELLAADAADAEVMYFTGMTLWLLENREEAEYYIAAAIGKGYATENTCFNLGMLLQEQEKYQQALDAYLETSTINPVLEDLNNNMGLVYASLDEPGKAEACLRKEIEHYPVNINALNNLGTLLKEQERYDEASGFLQQAIKLDPDFADACFNLGSVQILKGDTKKGIKNYQRAANLSKARDGKFNAEYIFNLGCLELAHGYFTDGWRHYSHHLQEYKLILEK